MRTELVGDDRSLSSPVVLIECLRLPSHPFATEGILQELPQSAQEQIAQNVALGRPWDEGVGNAAAMGTLAGGVTGVGGAAWAWRMRREPEQTEDDPIAESNAKASEAMDRLATVGTVAEMAKAAADVVDSSTLGPLGISAEQEARVMQAGEELAQADLTSIKNMGRLDRTRSPEPPAPIVPASEEGPAPFLDRLLTATEALQDPAVRQRVEQAAGPQYLAQLDQYAKVANTPGFMDGIGDQVRERFLGLLERAVFPDRFRQPAPPVQRAERRNRLRRDLAFAGQRVVDVGEDADDVAWDQPAGEGAHR